jgi:RNA ligase (TIGR02306 family)
MGVDTHKVEVVPIKLEKHPNADLLSVVRVYNFTCVVATESWVGVDKAAYVQPDSVMPDVPEYRYLKETQSLRKEKQDIASRLSNGEITPEEAKPLLDAVEAKIDANTKYLRIAVKKLRGVVSMGMLVKTPEGAEVGDDVAERLGITHYEPPSMDEIEGKRQHKGDDVAPPPRLVYAPKYDVESVYKYADCFEAGEPVYVTEKLDGQNGRYVTTLEESGICHCGDAVDQHNMGSGHSPVDNPDYVLHAGSRTEWKKHEGQSNWWRVLDQEKWVYEWSMSNPGRVLYGEVFGWVQTLKYGAKAGQLWFRAFDILDGTEYLDAEAFRAALPAERRVPELGIMPFDFEKLQALADGPSLVRGANHAREGIVVKPLVERKHWKLGRVMVKMVSNAYLEKSAR